MKWTCRVLCTRLNVKRTGDMARCQRSLTRALMSHNDVIDDVIVWCWDAITSAIKGRVHASDIRTAHSRIRGEKHACLIYVTLFVNVLTSFHYFWSSNPSYFCKISYSQNLKSWNDIIDLLDQTSQQCLNSCSTDPNISLNKTTRLGLPLACYCTEQTIHSQRSSQWLWIIHSSVPHIHNPYRKL